MSLTPQNKKERPYLCPFNGFGECEKDCALRVSDIKTKNGDPAESCAIAFAAMPATQIGLSYSIRKAPKEQR